MSKSAVAEFEGVDHQVEWRDPAKLKAHPRNARRHTASQIEMLAASIKRFGLTKPLLVDDDDTLLAGHGTTLAAVQAGLTEVPVIVARGWSDEDKRAYLLADNRLGDLSAWDHGVLAQEVTALKRLDPRGLYALGFSGKSVEQAMRRAQSTSAGVAQLGNDLGYAVVISCTDEAHQRALLERLQAEGLTCKPIIS